MSILTQGFRIVFLVFFIGWKEALSGSYRQKEDPPRSVSDFSKVTSRCLSGVVVTYHWIDVLLQVFYCIWKTNGFPDAVKKSRVNVVLHAKHTRFLLCACQVLSTLIKSSLTSNPKPDITVNTSNRTQCCINCFSNAQCLSYDLLQCMTCHGRIS